MTVLSLYYAIALLLLACLCLTVYSACPNQCNGHGLCTLGNVCACFDGWNGGAADCSFRK